jgi:hypothetical protein
MKSEMLATRNDATHDDLLTQDDIGARLKVTVRTVVRLQNDGVLPFILLGKAVRFYWPAVISHLIANFTVVRAGGGATGKGGQLRATGNRVTNKGGRP